MSCYLYVLRSEQKKRWYIGTAESVQDRLVKHNQELVRSTKAYRPWTLMYTEEHQTRDKARYREWLTKHSTHQRQKLYEYILRRWQGGVVQR